jgi:hypothetical protein
MSTEPELPIASKFGQTLTLAMPSGGELVIVMPSWFRDTDVYYKAAKRLFVMNPRAGLTKYYGFRARDGREYWLRVRHRLFNALPEISMNGRLIAVPPPTPRRVYVIAVLGGFPFWISFFSFFLNAFVVIPLVVLNVWLWGWALGMTQRYERTFLRVVVPLIMVGISWALWIGFIAGVLLGYIPILPDL